MSIKISRSWRQWSQYDDTFEGSELQALLRDPDKAIASATRYLKNDPTSTVALITVDGRQLVLKRSNRRSFWHGLKRCLFKTRAEKSWANARRLKALGIPSFTPVAMLVERFGFLRFRSYLLCTYLEGTDALHYFAKGAQPTSDWSPAATRIVNLFKRLARHRLSHRDLNLSNILLVDGEPHLIDLDAMRHHHFSFMSLYAAKKDQSRFMENWDELPEAVEAKQLFCDKISDI